jgi:DNA-binding NarL/FixJ family response regulator
MDIIDEAPDVTDALESARALRPDVIIMNDYLPPIDSAQAAALFREQGFTAGILVISTHPETELIQRSLQNCVNGFMHKDEIDDYLVYAIRHIHQGERYLSPKAKDVYGSSPE